MTEPNGTWVKVGCDERDDIIKKAGTERVFLVGSAGATEWRWRDTDIPLVRDRAEWGWGTSHCTHERFVPDASVEINPSLPVGASYVGPAPWRYDTRQGGSGG